MTSTSTGQPPLPLPRRAGMLASPVVAARRVNPDFIEVTAVSNFSGRTHRIELPITHAEWLAFVNRSPGELIQNLLPRLSADQREFLMTGTTAEEWNAAFPPEEPDPAEDGVDPDLCDDEGCPHHGTAHVCNPPQGDERIEPEIVPDEDDVSMDEHLGRPE